MGLVHDDIMEWHPDNDDHKMVFSRSVSYYSQMSTQSDYSMPDDYEDNIQKSDSIEFLPSKNSLSRRGINTDLSKEQIDEINQLAKWLPTDREVVATPIEERYSYW